MRGVDRGATLSERRQSGSASKRQARRCAVKLAVKRSNILPSTEHDDETVGADAFAPPGSRPDRQSVRRLLGSVNNPG